MCAHAVRCDSSLHDGDLEGKEPQDNSRAQSNLVLKNMSLSLKKIKNKNKKL